MKVTPICDPPHDTILRIVSTCSTNKHCFSGPSLVHNVHTLWHWSQFIPGRLARMTHCGMLQSCNAKNTNKHCFFGPSLVHNVHTLCRIEANCFQVVLRVTHCGMTLHIALKWSECQSSCMHVWACLWIARDKMHWLNSRCCRSSRLFFN